jgi:hypothetical protein
MAMSITEASVQTWPTMELSRAPVQHLDDYSCFEEDEAMNKTIEKQAHDLARQISGRCLTSPDQEFNYPEAENILTAALAKSAYEAADEIFWLLQPMLDEFQKSTSEAGKAEALLADLKTKAHAI